MIRSRPRPDRGFTLLEILMAISIFAIVISLAYGSYRSTFRVIDQTEARAEIANQARIAMDRLLQDLNCLYPGTDGFLVGATQTIDGNRADTAQFTSTAHLRLNRNQPPAGYATIAYTVREDKETGALNLFRQDRAFHPGEPEEQSGAAEALLCGGLREVRFLYADHNGDLKDDWDSKAIAEADTGARWFPEWIEITLLFVDPAVDGASVRFTSAATFPTANLPDSGNDGR